MFSKLLVSILITIVALELVASQDSETYADESQDQAATQDPQSNADEVQQGRKSGKDPESSRDDLQQSWAAKQDSVAYMDDEQEDAGHVLDKPESSTNKLQPGRKASSLNEYEMNCNQSFCADSCSDIPPPACPVEEIYCPSGCACYSECATKRLYCYSTKHCHGKIFKRKSKSKTPGRYTTRRKRRNGAMLLSPRNNTLYFNIVLFLYALI